MAFRRGQQIHIHLTPDHKPLRRPILSIFPVAVRSAVTATVIWLAAVPCQAHPTVMLTGQTPGATPFINLIGLTVDNPAGLDYITFTIQPKPGSVTRPISARYSAAYLQNRAYFQPTTGAVSVPVFGLYAGYDNTVVLKTAFTDGYSQSDTVTVATKAYHHNLHKRPQFVQARTSDTSLSYDFIELKSFEAANSPLILDTDGELRWAGTANVESSSAILYDNGIYVADGTMVLRMEFDGTVTPLADYSGGGVIDFFHNFDYGRDGIITQPDTTAYFESTEMEVDPITGKVLHTWNMAQIISDAMTAGGDDPTLFVKASPDDWFHTNCTAYRPSDNTLIVSSRENFVVALDYDTQAIKWILGDPTKYWYQFASLRKYALALSPGAHAPIGQHGMSIVRDRLLLFDNGNPSLNQPVAGASRLYSAPRKYLINTTAGTATETWHYNNNKSVACPFCSSAYEDTRNNFLIDYATADNAAYLELLGLNANGLKVFDYRFTEVDECASGWNAVPIHLESLVFN